MKTCLVLLCAVAFVGLSTAAVTGVHSRGCRYILGKCFEECPIGTHSYTMGCSQITPEPTCEEPNPVKGRGIICDYSACYCDPPTVRNNGKCIPYEECPKKATSKSEAETHA